MEYVKDYQVLIGLVLIAVAILIGSLVLSEALIDALYSIRVREWTGGIF